MTTVAGTHVLLQDRDLQILRLVHQLGAATPQHVHGVSRRWDTPFADLHTVRRRLRKLQGAGWLHSYPLGVHVLDSRHYYRLTRRAFRLLHPDAPIPRETLFRAVADSRQRHALALADVLAHTVAACQQRRVRVLNFRREDEVLLEAYGTSTSPDHFLQLETSGKTFNLFLEIDRGTEPVDSFSLHSVQGKLAAYEAYQDLALAQWRFRYRAIFLTTSMERVHTILSSALRQAKNPDRLVCYAATLDAFLADGDPLRTPLFLDHHGRFQSLIDIHPTAAFRKTSVRLRSRVTEPLHL